MRELPKIEMETKPCEKCGKKAKEVIYAQENLRQGWYCPACGHFDRAKVRERMTDGK